MQKLFDNSPDLMFASLLGGRRLTKEQIERLRRMVALCSHWFNPLVWAMYVLSNRGADLQSVLS